jgi:hypothetical protein
LQQQMVSIEEEKTQLSYRIAMLQEEVKTKGK